MKEIIEKYVSIWNSNETAHLGGIFSEKSTYWDTTQAGSAIEILKSAIATTHEAFSDVLFEINSLDATSKSQFFLEWRMTGKNTGAFWGNPPTGNSIEIHGLDAIRLKLNTITEIKSFYDSSLFGQQLGLQ